MPRIAKPQHDSHVRAYRADLARRNALVEQWSGLADHFAKRMLGIPAVGRMGFEEARCAALLGLVQASRRFEFERGFKFSTYAWWWCRMSVQRASENYGREIAIPLANLASPMVADPDNSPFDQIFQSKGPFDPSLTLERQELTAALLERLPRRWAEIMRLRYFEDLSLREIGVMVGISKERVRQLEQRSLAILRGDAPAHVKHSQRNV